MTGRDVWNQWVFCFAPWAPGDLDGGGPSIMLLIVQGSLTVLQSTVSSYWVDAAKHEM